MKAANGVVIHDSLTSTGASGSAPINIDADTDGDGGTFTVSTTKSLTTNSNTLRITCYDVDLQNNGAIRAGSYGIFLEGSSTQTVGFGATSQQMHLDGAELQRMSASSLTFGSTTSGSMTVNQVTLNNVGDVSGVVSL